MTLPLRPGIRRYIYKRNARRKISLSFRKNILKHELKQSGDKIKENHRRMLLRWNQKSGYAVTGTQRLHQIMDPGADMRMGSLEGRDTPAADHTAVFVVGFGKHDDVLGGGALRDHIAPAQTGPKGLAQLLHDPVGAPLAEGLVRSTGDAEKCHVGDGTASFNGPAFGLAQHFEIIVITLQGAGRRFRFLKMLQHLIHSNGTAAGAVCKLPVDIAGLFVGTDPEIVKEPAA